MVNISCGGENKMKKKKIKMESSGDGDGDADRISGIPDSILHTIFSSIDMKQVVQTSVLSRRWRHFWKSAPDLCFNCPYRIETYTPRRKSGEKVYHKDTPIDFVDRVLLLRDDSNIHKFHLSRLECDPSRIETWLIFAGLRCVENLHLINSISIPNSPTHFPLQLFTTLKVLQLHACGSIRLPTSVFSASHLRILKLVSLTLHFTEDDSSGELVLSCPSLEDLVWNQCFIKDLKILNISAHQLKNLEIQNWDPSVCSCEIKICTPNLTSLTMSGSSYKNYFLQNLSSLTTCCIRGYRSYVGSECSLPMQSVMKILNAVTNVSTLELYAPSCSKALPSEDVYDQMLDRFPNLRLLKVGLSSGYDIRPTVNLLKCSPSIKTLVWDAIKEYPYYIYCKREMEEVEDWGELLSFRYIFDQLRYIEAQNIKGTMNELKFFECLLKNAVQLENIKITLVQEVSMDEKLKEFKKKLLSLPKASSSVQIFFSQPLEDKNLGVIPSFFMAHDSPGTST